MTERRPPLTMEEYATVLAYLSHYPGAPRADVFVRLEVNPAEWKEADEGLSNAMIQELLEEQRALSDIFNSAFVQVKRRLKKEMPELASVLPLRPPLAVAPPAVAAPPAPVFAPPAAVVAPPAFIFAPPAPVVSDRDALLPVGMRHFKSLKGTEAAADPAPAPALPFRASLPGEPSTLAGSEPRSLVPVGMRGFTNLSGTQGASPLPASPALPFAGAKGPPPAPPPPAPPPPFAGKPPLELPSFSTEQYASLCVELELDPARAAETLQRYRLTAEQWIALDTAWRERLARAPDLYAAWSQAIARYKAWKLQQPRR